MKTWGNLMEDSPFREIFPDGKVPLRSCLPMIPRAPNEPSCYVVDPTFLSEEQVTNLAYKLYNMWQPECPSVAYAADYIRGGLPLKCDHFSSVSSADLLRFII